MCILDKSHRNLTQTRLQFLSTRKQTISNIDSGIVDRQSERLNNEIFCSIYNSAVNDDDGAEGGRGGRGRRRVLLFPRSKYSAAAAANAPYKPHYIDLLFSARTFSVGRRIIITGRF